VIHSAEATVNEYCLPLFQETDLRVFPPGYGNDIIPLYQFLFHECIVLQGMMSSGQEPYHLEIANAANAVLGEIPGGVLAGDGSLVTRDTNNWAPWQPVVGDPDKGLAMIRSVTALRRGPGKDFLVFGRMLRPAGVEDIPLIEWKQDGVTQRVPAVFHSAWQAPDGRTGVVLANWTDRDHVVTVRDDRLAMAGAADGLAVTVPALGCALLAGEVSIVR
jgi:hypothetical protein